VLRIVTADDEHTVRASFATVGNLVPGLEVRVRGVKVGSISSVSIAGGRAELALGIRDKAVWPLHAGTTARIRWGTTAGLSSGFVELSPGPRDAPTLQDGGVLLPGDAASAVQAEQVLRTFDVQARQDTRHLLSNLARSLRGRELDLNRALENSPSGIGAVADVTTELAADIPALRTLVAHGARATRTIAGHDADVRQLVSGAAATLDVLARHADAVGGTLVQLPGTLRQARATLARLHRSIGPLQRLTVALGDANPQLRSLAPVAARAIAALDITAPRARDTLQQAAVAAVPATRMLRTGVPFISQLGQVSADLTPAATCIRPYAPEVVGFASTWGGFTKNYDDQAHYVRLLIQASPTVNGAPVTAAQLGKLGVEFALPRGPGVSARQPWYQPNCGSTPQQTDPGHDPEAAGKPK
jgi:phospholipid/cholesterol/gamma-HCH transport system substrate-binding protein